MNKTYKISSEHNLWEPSTIQVNDKGFIVDVQPMVGASIVIGSKFESMKAFWESFQGENAYKIEELNGTN